MASCTNKISAFVNESRFNLLRHPARWRYNALGNAGKSGKGFAGTRRGQLEATSVDSEYLSFRSVQKRV